MPRVWLRPFTSLGTPLPSFSPIKGLSSKDSKKQTNTNKISLIQHREHGNNRVFLGLSRRGVSVYDLGTNGEVGVTEPRMSWPFSAISSVTPGSDTHSIVLVTGNLMKPLRNTFTLDRVCFSFYLLSFMILIVDYRLERSNSCIHLTRIGNPQIPKFSLPPQQQLRAINPSCSYYYVIIELPPSSPPSSPSCDGTFLT